MVRFILATLSLAFLLAAGPGLHERLLTAYVGQTTVMLTHLLNPRTGGSGFQIMTADGPRIITNAHVCELGKEHGVLMSENMWKEDPLAILKILKVDKAKDLCMLEGRSDLWSLRLGWFKADILDTVYTVGHPALEETTLSSGMVRGEVVIEIGSLKSEEECSGRMIDAMFFQLCLEPFDAVSTSITTAPGASGSAIINPFGQVVGVLFAGSGRTGHAYYVPFNLLKDFLP